MQVEPTDTLASVAAHFDTTPSELAILNRLSSRTVFPGQVIRVPDKSKKVSKDGSTDQETQGDASEHTDSEKQDGASEAVHASDEKSDICEEEMGKIWLHYVTYVIHNNSTGHSIISFEVTQ